MPISRLLRSAISRVISRQTPSSFTIKLVIRNENDDTYKLEPYFIEQLTIRQDFLNTYTDEVLISFKISPINYIKLYKNMSGLIADLKMSYLGVMSASIDRDKPPIEKRFRAFLNDPKDIEQHLQDTASRSEDTMTVSLQLIEEEAYKFRLGGISGIYKNTTMENLIKDACSRLGVKKISMIRADNRTVYPQPTIPSVKGVDSMFDTLNSKYGIYFNGFNYYYTKETLFIYPPYTTDPKTDDVVNIYLGDIGSLAGVDSCYSMRGDILDLVLEGNPDGVDLSGLGSENHANMYAIKKSRKTFDTFTENAGESIARDNVISIASNKSKMVLPNVKRMVYSGQSDNPYKLASDIAKYQATIIEGVWINAIPWLLNPGHKVIYSYDRNEIVETANGQVEAASFIFNRGERFADGYRYAGTGSVRFRIESYKNANTQ